MGPLGIFKAFCYPCITQRLSGQFLIQREVDGHIQDRTLGPGWLAMIEKDDLVLPGIGYFGVTAFAVIETRQVFWLSRLHGQATVAWNGGSALENRLASTNAHALELKVTLTQRAIRRGSLRSGPTPRLRPAGVGKKDKRNGTRPSKRTLTREEWNILVTNIPGEKCSADELVAPSP